MRRILVDSGILLSYYQQQEPLHQAVVDFFDQNAAQLITSPICIAEVLWLLGNPGDPRALSAQNHLLGAVSRGGIEAINLLAEDYARKAASRTLTLGQDTRTAHLHPCAPLIVLRLRCGQRRNCRRQQHLQGGRIRGGARTDQIHCGALHHQPEAPRRLAAINEFLHRRHLQGGGQVRIGDAHPCPDQRWILEPVDGNADQIDGRIAAERDRVGA